jgi:hypothetical protein
VIKSNPEGFDLAEHLKRREKKIKKLYDESKLPFSECDSNM